MRSLPIQVASEDTVLHTAQAYTNSKAAAGCDQQPLVDKLAPLVRCPHLSQFWLSAALLSGDADKLLLQGLQPQLKQLLLLKQSHSKGLSADVITKHAADAPASWLLPVRDIKPVYSTKLEWEVDVAAIRQKAQDSASQQKDTILRSPDGCMLGGVRWGMSLDYEWDASKQGSTLGLYTHAKNLPAGTFCRCTNKLECIEVANSRSGQTTDLFSALQSSRWGYDDFFKLGAMSGGFDEAAWAVKGLPASGNITLRLTVSNVGV
jgi:hypothetical protein